MLGLMPGTEDLLDKLIGVVLNVNFPSCKLADVKGIQRTHQSGACVESGYVLCPLLQREPVNASLSLDEIDLRSHTQHKAEDDSLA